MSWDKNICHGIKPYVMTMVLQNSNGWNPKMPNCLSLYSDTTNLLLPSLDISNEQTCSLQITDSVYYMYSSFQFHPSSINRSARFSEQLRTKPVSQSVSQSVSYRRPLSQELTSICKQLESVNK